jgi:hypothetical protein
MGTVLKIIEYAHVAVSIFLTGLLEVCKKHKILHLDASNKSNIVGGAHLVLVLTPTKMFNITAITILAPFPDSGIRWDKVFQGVRILEILLIGKFVTFRHVLGSSIDKNGNKN